jgi:anti-sigma factor RsiW
MTDCVHFAPMIGSRDGELTGADATALAAHLDGCARCRAIAADLAAADGLVGEALLAGAAARDFAPFVDGVMARIPEYTQGEAGVPAAGGVLGWLHGHSRAAAATLAPALAALALFMYVRSDADRADEIALLELSSEGNVSMVLQTSDGPVVLLASEEG